MGIQEYLGPDEKIQSEFRKRNTTYYATDRRVIQYKSGVFSEKMKDLDYDHITSVNAKSGINWAMSILGGSLFFIGILIYLASSLIPSFPIPSFPIPSILCFLGLIIAVLGLLCRENKYSLHGISGEMIGEETMTIREIGFKGWEPKKEDGKEIIQTVRKLKKRKIGKKSAPDKETSSEKISKKQESGEISCPKCGKEVSSSNNYCPSCGQSLDYQSILDRTVEDAKKEIKKLDYVNYGKLINVEKSKKDRDTMTKWLENKKEEES